jgi:N6-adenosine-specific RNA methylase IME4
MPRTFTDLGPAQQRFMRRALHEGVPLDDPLATQLVKRKPERVTRAQALEARGLIHQRESKKGRLVALHGCWPRAGDGPRSGVPAQARVPVVHAEAVAGDARRARGHGPRSMTRYRTIVADPPWPFKWSTPATRVNGRGERHRNHTRALAYVTMTVDDIADVVAESRIAIANDAHLFLWTTDAMLVSGEATRVCKAWGFAPQRTLVWSKAGYGLGHGFRPSHELILVGRRGVLPFSDVSLPTVFEWKQPYVKTGNSVARLHSAKPDGFLDIVEQVSPGPYLEMFARRARFGWDYYGDESLANVEISA